MLGWCPHRAVGIHSAQSQARHLQQRPLIAPLLSLVSAPRSRQRDGTAPNHHPKHHPPLTPSRVWCPHRAVGVAVVGLGGWVAVAWGLRLGRLGTWVGGWAWVWLLTLGGCGCGSGVRTARLPSTWHCPATSPSAAPGMSLACPCRTVAAGPAWPHPNHWPVTASPRLSAGWNDRHSLTRQRICALQGSPSPSELTATRPVLAANVAAHQLRRGRRGPTTPAPQRFQHRPAARRPPSTPCQAPPHHPIAVRRKAPNRGCHPHG